MTNEILLVNDNTTIPTNLNFKRYSVYLYAIR